MDNQLNEYDNGGGYNNGGRGNGPGNGGGGGNQPPKRPNIMMLVLAVLSTLLIMLMLWNVLFGTSDENQVTYSQFLQLVEQDRVATANLLSTAEIQFTL